MKSVCFTGHRKISEDTKTLSQKLYKKLEKAINNGVTDFYAGGAIGWDTLAALTVIELRKNYPYIKLHLVLPCPPDEQSRLWSDEQRRVFFDIIKTADTVEQTSDHYSYDCMKIRNARLADYADYCFCYYNPNEYKSGTGQTVRMIRKKGIEIINFWNPISD